MTAPITALALLIGLWLGWPACFAAFALAVGLIVSRKFLFPVPVPFGTLCLAAIALVLGAVRGATAPETPPIPWADGADRFEGIIVSPPRTDSTWQRFDLRVNRVRIENDWQDADVLISVTAPRFPDVGYGDAIGLVGALEPNEDLPRGYGRNSDSRGVSGSAFAYAVWVEERGSGPRRTLFDLADRMVLSLRTAVPGDAGVFLAGLVTGDDTALSDSRETRFVRTGTSHLTAVSGANVAIIVTLLVSAGAMLGWRRSAAVQIGIVGSVWTYATMTGLETPVVRAALMVTLALAATRIGRRADYFGAALIAAAIIAFLEPRDLHSVAFGLSFSASLALAAVFQGLLVTGPRDLLVQALAGTVVAQIATLPITLAAFGTIPLASVPANVLIAPLVAIAFPLALAASVIGLVWQAAGEIVAVAAGWFADLALHIVDAFGTVDWLLVSVPPLSPSATTAVALTAGVALLLVSRDGNRWLRRLGRTPPPKRPPNGRNALLSRSERKPTGAP